MNWLLQQPLVIIVAGAVVVLILFGVMQQTGKKWTIYAMVAAVFLTAGMLVLERMVVTPEEALRATLHAIAKDVERNDVDAVLSHISRNSPSLENQVRAVMTPYRAEVVKITKIRDVVVQPQGTVASARVNVRAVGGDRHGMFEHQPILREFKVNFALEDGVWRVSNYESTSGNPLQP